MTPEPGEVRRRLARFDALCANPVDIVVVLDTEARYRYLSPSVETVLGYRPQDIVGDLCFDYYHPDDIPRIRRVSEESVSTARIPRPVVMRVRHAEGHYVWIEATASPVFDPESGDLVEILGINRDISDRIRLEHELYQAQRSEVAALMASSATHDLNNLLMMIAALAESLEEGLSAAGEMRADAAAVRSAALNAGSLTRQLLGLSAPPRVAGSVFSANDMVRHVAAMADRVDAKRCRVEARIDPADPHLRGEASQLEQVLLNLVLNACACSTVERPVRVTLATRVDGERVVLTCEDDGPGIPVELHERIFEPRFTTRSEQGGSGLGLSTARRITEGWGGTIRVDSAPGEGACFTISLPGAGPGEVNPREASSGRHVLVIEPQAPLRAAIRRFLDRAGHACTCVAGESEAVRAFEEHPETALIIADDRPAGWEIARSLGRSRPTPVLYMSAAGAPPDDLAHDELFLAKPFSSGDLAAAVRTVLGVPPA